MTYINFFRVLNCRCNEDTKIFNIYYFYLLFFFFCLIVMIIMTQCKRFYFFMNWISYEKCDLDMFFWGFSVFNLNLPFRLSNGKVSSREKQQVQQHLMHRLTEESLFHAFLFPLKCCALIGCPGLGRVHATHQLFIFWFHAPQIEIINNEWYLNEGWCVGCGRCLLLSIWVQMLCLYSVCFNASVVCYAGLWIYTVRCGEWIRRCCMLLWETNYNYNSILFNCMSALLLLLMLHVFDF